MRNCGGKISLRKLPAVWHGGRRVYGGSVAEAGLTRRDGASTEEGDAVAEAFGMTRRDGASTGGWRIGCGS